MSPEKIVTENLKSRLVEMGRLTDKHPNFLDDGSDSLVFRLNPGQVAKIYWSGITLEDLYSYARLMQTASWIIQDQPHQSHKGLKYKVAVDSTLRPLDTSIPFFETNNLSYPVHVALQDYVGGPRLRDLESGSDLELTLTTIVGQLNYLFSVRFGYGVMVSDQNIKIGEDPDSNTVQLTITDLCPSILNWVRAKTIAGQPSGSR